MTQADTNGQSQPISPDPEETCETSDCQHTPHQNRLALGDNFYCGIASPATECAVVAISYDRGESSTTIHYTLDCGCIWERREFNKGGVHANFVSVCSENPNSWELADATPAERRAMDIFQKALKESS